MSRSTPFTILFLEFFTHLLFIPSFWRLKFSFFDGGGGGGGDDDCDEEEDDDSNHDDKVTGMHYQDVCTLVQEMCLKM